MKLAESVKPISYLKANAADIIREVSTESKSFIITQNGEAKAVVMDLAAYEALQESLALLKMLSQSQESLKKGKIRPFRSSFSRVRAKMARLSHEKV